ncbi:hypothetical protein TSAR_004637 [Trichomalopsis sarcophagae]|uniref:Cysteine-rich PDZ-binding protein n=1 Tax=Trichomalopsis sarcophagae TaxID=543379 RepID=A0A232FB57_9HYME|nr:hypothetical protein TSAR_004637 [Trichomalopsis sarcophagae]
MVCGKCEKKLRKVVTPDPWKDGVWKTVQNGGCKVGGNKALTKRRSRINPYSAKFGACKICRQKTHQAGTHYCQSCAYKKAICAMCGKKLMSTNDYRQSVT